MDNKPEYRTAQEFELPPWQRWCRSHLCPRLHRHRFGEPDSTLPEEIHSPHIVRRGMKLMVGGFPLLSHVIRSRVSERFLILFSTLVSNPVSSSLPLLCSNRAPSLFRHYPLLDTSSPCTTLNSPACSLQSSGYCVQQYWQGLPCCYFLDLPCMPA